MTTPASVNIKPQSDFDVPTTTHRHDPHCFACGQQNPHGLQLNFRPHPECPFDVTTQWIPPTWTAGYPGVVHGGIIASVLDAAMTHALLFHEICAVTAELTVRYSQSVVPGHECQITGQCVTPVGPIYQVSANITQNGKRCAHANARFMIAKQRSL